MKKLIYKNFSNHDHIDIEASIDIIGMKIANAFITNKCPNCLSKLDKFENIFVKAMETSDGKFYDEINHLSFCSICGWWQIKRTYEKITFAYSYHSILKQIDLSKNEAEIEELKIELHKNWEKRKHISASQAENFVKSLLQEKFSSEVFHTTPNVNAPDGGIDLYIAHSNSNIKTAIQVKRRINGDIESVKNIRDFVGALVLEGYTKGIYITTASKFTSNLEQFKSKMTKTKFELDYYDGNKLLEILNEQISNDKIKLPLGLKEDSKFTRLSDKVIFSFNELLIR